ncbi:hypothetical protein ACFL03_15710 [Thermodesulfobacteriota bacterium]
MNYRVLKVKKKVGMEEEKGELQEDLDWDSRTLCSDESCIGVIGHDGRCKECGSAGEGEAQKEAHKTGVDDENADEDEGELEAEDDEDIDSASDLDWDSRTLCSDESCIGVIGPDGRCKECGERLENESPPA